MHLTDFTVSREDVKVMEGAFNKENLCFIRCFMSSWVPHVFQIQANGKNHNIQLRSNNYVNLNAFKYFNVLLK